jgi:hypothetical protein
MKKKQPLVILCRVICLIVFIITLNSCIGISSDIQMQKDGSGRITLEYRFSGMAETIGRLDGNQQWHIIPASRSDLERTLAQIPDIRLVSFSSRQRPSVNPQSSEKDIVNTVTLAFRNPQALISFLDSSGKRAVFSRQNNANQLTIILNDPISSQINPDLISLTRQVSLGYMFKMSFSADGNSTVTFTDGTGKAISTPPNAEVISSGKKVSLAISTSDLLELYDGLGIVFSF